MIWAGWSLVLAALVAVGPTVSAGQVPVRRVSVFGDSLMTEAADPFAVDLGADATVSESVFPGTAPCDWSTEMTADAATHPTAVVLEFSGNALTPCIAGADYETPAYFDQYGIDVSAAVDAYVNAGTHVFLVGNAPTLSQVNAHDTRWNTLNWNYSAMAANLPGRVTFVNAGAAVESASGQFVWTVPGRPGLDVVRAPDGQHFCSAAVLSWPEWRSCGSLAPGAIGYARAIAAAVGRYLKTGSAPAYVGPPLDPENVAPTMAPGQVDPY